ncbi:MAG TPA: AAA family ATPase [Solirubrobacteraceae bacterium]|nr:AAA family ATPase [Solirubrobacteraceae bacterium]
MGRKRECTEIDRLLDGARREVSGALVLRGEAGMGKSALVGYAAAAARAAGMMVLGVTGVEWESDMAFAGLHGLLWPVIDELGCVPEPQREPLAAALGLAPGEGRDRFLVSAGALSLLAAAAEARPILCVIDDAQWLDVSSAHSLTFVARRLFAEQVAIVFGAREGESRRFDAPGLPELAVTGLDRSSASRLLEYSAPGAAPSVRERLLDEAAGNPLALLELPVALSEQQLTGEAPLPGALPMTARLRASFSQRIECLPAATRQALLIAAAEEAGELAVTLRAAGELELPDDALDPAEEIGLVRTDGSIVSFRHPLVRSVVYESATLGQRQRTHAALAAALDGAGSAERAVWHRAMGAVTENEEVAAALEASAQRSELRGGHASAASALERAAALSETSSERARRLSAAAQAAWTDGQGDRAAELIRRALPIADRPQRAWLLLIRGIIEGQSGWLLDGVATMRQGLAVSEDPSVTLQLLREGFAMASQAHAIEEATDFASRAADVTPAGEIDSFTKASLIASAAELSCDYERSRSLSAEQVERADGMDVPVCLIWASLAAARVGMRREALHHANRAVSYAREQGAMTTLPFCLQVQAAALIGESRLELAYASADEGWRLALDTGQLWAASWNLMRLVQIDALRGDEEIAHAHAAELGGLVARSGAAAIGQHAKRSLALLDMCLGRPADALERLLPMISTAQPGSHPLFLYGLPDTVETAARADRLGEVSAHVDRYREWVEQYGSPEALALLARCRGLIDESAAEEHFVRAIELAPALSQFDAARTELLYGEWLRRRRRRIDARRHLRSALECFGRLGMAPWEARARSELRASGETARRRDPSTLDQLTPQELQIARLVAGGKTNPEVAAQLFLSTRTIDYHLRKVYSKLDIASRGELARIDLGEPVAA